MSKQSLKLSWQLLRREWRSGELRILILALVTAIAAVTAIGFFTDRLTRAMLAQSAELIGGDLVLRSSRPLDPAWLEQARQRGLDATEIVSFSSVVVYGDELLLSSVKVVGSEYPIRGTLRVADSPYAEDYALAQAPEPGTLWLDQRVLDRLGMQVGEELQVGNQVFTAARIITYEPDRGGNLFNLQPRVIFNQADLEAAGVLAPGSRASFAHYYAGDGIADFRVWLEDRLALGQRLTDVKTGSRASGLLETAEQYLQLTSLLAILLAAVAIAVVVQRYSKRHYDVSAMLRCLGASQQMILNIYLYQLFLLALTCGLAGIALGWGLHWLLLTALADLIPAGLPSPGWSPVFVGLATGAIILAGTALPPVLRLKSVPPLRVIRRDMTPLPVQAWMAYLVAWGALVALVFMLSNNVMLVLGIITGVLLMAGLLILAIKLFIGHIRRLGKSRSLIGKGLQRLAHRSNANAGQIIAFAITITLMLVIGLLRTELLANWQTQLPESTPNYFAYNILPSDAAGVTQFLSERGALDTPVYPMVRGRLTEINGEAIANRRDRAAEENPNEEEGGPQAPNRELNLTWTAALPNDNELVEGQWWDELAPQAQSGSGPVMVSIEQGFAMGMQVGIGDRLSFDIAGQRLEAEIASFRTVNWESFTPNFFLIFPPGGLDNYPATYITSFRLPPEDRAAISELVRQFPALTLIEVEAIVAQLRSILDQVSLAVELMLLLVLIEGFAVLFAAIQNSAADRLHEGALMRVMGAGRRYLRGLNLVEFGALGLISGLLAVIATQVINLILYRSVFEIDYVMVWHIWLWVPIIAAVVVAAAGYWGTRDTLTHSPASVLRRC